MEWVLVGAVSFPTNTLAMIDMFLDGPFSLVSNHIDFHHMILSRDRNVVETRDSICYKYVSHSISEETTDVK